VVPIFDPNNLMLLFMLFFVICLPLSFLTVLIFFAVEKIPSQWTQGLVIQVMGILFVGIYMSMEPSASGNDQIFMSLIGILIHPLLILSPVMFLRKYLHRIPVPYAVFITALISLFVLVATGALQGDLRYGKPEGIQFILEVIVTIMKDFLIASVAFGILVYLDSFFPKSDEHSS
jgi:hypothetical protein